MLQPSNLHVVADWKLDEIHPAVKNPGTVAVHDDVVLPQIAVKSNTRPGMTVTFSSVTRTLSLQCKTMSSDTNHSTSNFLPSPMRRRASTGSRRRLLYTNLPEPVPCTEDALSPIQTVEPGGLFGKVEDNV